MANKISNKTFVQNNTFTVADNDAVAYGSSVAGTEIIRILSGVTNVKLDANFERVELTGALANYKFSVVAGTGLQILNVTDSKVVATIPNINQDVKIAFADGSALLHQLSSTGFTLNNVLLTVGEINAATTPSLSGENVLDTTAGAASTIAAAPAIFKSISAEGDYTATNGIDTFNISAGNYTATINGGFAFNDKIVFPFLTQVAVTNAPLDGADPLTAGTDGLLTLTGALLDKVVTINLTGVSHLLDEQVFDTTSFIKTFGPGSLVAQSAPTAPTGTVTITGTPTQGQILTVSNDLADADGMGTVSYKWYADGAEISGVTATTFTLTQAQVGKAITAKASYTDLGGKLEIVTSSATANVANINDAPTGTVTISGTPTQNEVLTASNNLVDVDVMGTVSYKWYANGIEISGNTVNTLALTQAQVGKAITAKASYTDGGNTLESVTSSPTVSVANINDAPTGAVTISGTPTQGQTLTVANTLADADGLVNISYKWYADGAEISGATVTTFTLTQAQVGKAITAKASYTDAGNAAELVASTATAAVANINDLPTGSVTISGNATQEQVLTASHTLADMDGLGTISYQWLSNGSAISGATGATFTLTQAEVGKTVSVKANYTDLLGTLESQSSSQTDLVASKANSTPTGSVTISGTPTQGQVLTASNNLVDVDGLGAITYKWYADGAEISGANEATFTLTQAEVGKAITAKGSYTDLLGTAESKTSTSTSSVANINDAPTGTVMISGTPTQGQVLTASNTLADVDGLGTISYKWYAGVDEISGATLTTFTLTQAEVGKAITAKASYTDGGSKLETVESAATTLVVAPTITYSATTFAEAPANDGSIAGSVTLTLANDTYTGTDGQVLAGAVVTNAPAGLTPVVTKTSSTVATVTFTGNATAHANTNDISNLTITLDNTAFTGGSAASITNATKANLIIDFTDPAASVDTVAPILTVAASQAIKNTSNAVIQSNEVGAAYLIKSTLAQPTTKAAADTLVATATAGSAAINAVSGQVIAASTNTNIAATGLIDGLYKVYAVDAAGNLSTAAANTIKVDTTAPSATSVANTDTGGDSIGVYAVSDKITITFSEPVNTTTLTINDLAISNSHILGTGASLSAVSPVNGFATSFDITLGTNPTLAAYDTISVASSKAVDAVSNANSGTVDFTVPFIGPVISSASSQPVVTDGNDIFNILINSSYSASIAGFNIGDQLVFPPSTVLAFSNGAEPDSKFTFTATYLSANVATIDLIELNDGLDVVTDYASFINKFGQLSIIGAVIPEVSAA